MEGSGYLPTGPESSASNGSSTVVAPVLIANSPHGVTEVFHFESFGGLPLTGSAPFSPGQDDLSDSEMPESEQIDSTMEFPRAGYAGLDALQYPTYRNISTIPEDSDDGDAGDLFQGYDDLTTDRERSSSASSPERDDDPDDTRRFYLGENDTRSPMPTDVSMEPVSDIDLDDFYRDPSYVPMSMETVASAELDHISDEEEFGDVDFAGGHMADAAIHRTSTMT